MRKNVSLFSLTMIELFITIWLMLLGLGYLFIAILVLQGLNKASQPLTDICQNFSVIIAARNEENNISELLTSLIKQKYPYDKFEIIVANDRSTDSTLSIVQKFVTDYPSIRILDIAKNNSGMPNKKNALNEAIKIAKNEILVFTDADCVVQENWLTNISRQFLENVGVVAGYSPFIFHSLKSTFNSFLCYEEFKNSILAAAGIGLNSAFLSTGRNFAYRKKVFDQVGGFEKIKHSISGDDDLFLQLVQRNTKWKIRFMTSRESFVYTQPPKTFSQFIHQRIRHISASKYYSNKIKALFALSHFFMLCILVSFFVTPLYGLTFLVIRWNLDAMIVTRGQNIFQEKITAIEFFRNELLLIAYTFGVGPLGLFKKFNWKGVQ